MGKPRAALVATAKCTGTLHQTMKGTLTKPPPAPTRPDSMPMPAPAPNWPAGPGIWRLGAGRLLRSICQPEKLTKAPKTRASQAPLSKANMPAPASRPPARMPGARPLTRSQRTAPRW